MINIAISTQTLETRPDLKEHIESLLNENSQPIFNVSHINNLNDKKTNIFIVNLDAYYDEIVIHNTEGYFIFVGNDLSKIILDNNACNNYFIKKPIDYDKLDEILLHIRKKIQKNFIVVQTNLGDLKLQISELNYVNIEGRSLCYHLVNDEKFYSNSLTGSFKKAITPLDKHEMLLFLHPALLLNVSKIRIIDTNIIYFENGEKINVSSKSREIIQKEWEAFHEFDNLYGKF